MEAHSEVLVENAADAEEVLKNEDCPRCGNVLVYHYDACGEWLACETPAPAFTDPRIH